MSDDRYVKVLLTSVAGVLMAAVALAMLFFAGEAVLGVVRGMTRLLVLLVPLVLVVAAVAGIAISISRKRIWERHEAERARAERDERLAEAADPLPIARQHAPETVADVERALASIKALRRLPPLDMPIVAEALSLADNRMPALLGRHAAAMAGANEEERREIARHTLSGVVIIGRSCEDARAAAVAALGDDVETEARYLAARTDDNDLTR